MSITFRPIQPTDNLELAKIIRASLEEFNVPKQGTVYSDPTTDALFELFDRTPGSCYLIAEQDGVMLGGCGVYPTEGLPTAYAELVKLYLSPASRGKGIGKMLMNRCFEAAAGLGYTHLYLESFPQLANAISLYHKIGFKSIDHALGNSGHFACNVWMVRDLTPALSKGEGA